MDFIIFVPSKIHVSSTGSISSLSPPRCYLSSGRCRHIIVPCHASFLRSQDELTAFVSSSDNTSSHRLLSRAETEALNPHRLHWPPSSDCLTPTIHCYKKVISTFVTLLTTQPRLHFASSLVRAARHQSSTRSRLMPIILSQNNTHSDELVDSLSLFEHLISM
jgi:hypothetical protein